MTLTLDSRPGAHGPWKFAMRSLLMAIIALGFRVVVGAGSPGWSSSICFISEPRAEAGSLWVFRNITVATPAVH